VHGVRALRRKDTAKTAEQPRLVAAQAAGAFAETRLWHSSRFCVMRAAVLAGSQCQVADAPLPHRDVGRPALLAVVFGGVT
jgi:hypothetical protein